MATDQGAAPDKDTAAASKDTGQGSSALTASDSTATQAAASSLTDGGSAKPPAWIAQLEGDLQKDEKLTQYKSISELAKAYKEAEGKLGKAIVLPGEKASAEEMATFRKATGVPEKPEDYKLEKVELPGQLELDGKWSKELKELAHKLNLSQGQLGGLHDWYFKNLVAEMQVVKTTAEQAHQLLRKEMGATDYDAGMTYMNRATKKFLTPEGAVLYARTGMGNHPETLKMWIAIGKAMGEHFFAEGSRGEKTETAVIGKRTDAELAEALYGKKE